MWKKDRKTRYKAYVYDKKEKEKLLLELDLTKELFEMMDEENRRLSGKVSELEKEKEELRKGSCPKDLLLFNLPSEPELYDGEYKDVVFQALVDALSNIPEEKASPNRTRDIISGFLKANKVKKENLPKAKFQAGLRDVNTAASFEKFLKANGFVKGTENGHVKWKYKNDPRYMIVVAKSPSDYRAYKNDGSIAKHVLF